MIATTAASAQVVDKRKAQKSFELAQMLQFNANLQGAAAALSQAISFNPDFYEAHLQLANLEVRLGEKNQATKEFQELVRLKPNDLPVQMALGSSLRAASRNKEAIAVFKTASALPHTGVEPETQLAFTYIEADQLENAASELDKLQKIEPNSPAIMLGLSIAQFRNGDTEHAKQSLQKVLQLNPNEATALSLLGDLESAGGNIELGIENYRKAINADKRFAQSYIALGNLYLNQKNLAAADAVFASGFESCPSNFDITCGLAIAREAEGQKEKAVALFEQALQFEGSADKKNQVRNHLQEIIDKPAP